MQVVLSVFEKRPRWTPELKRQFAGEAVRVRGCRRTEDLRGSRVALLEFEAHPAECLQFLSRHVGDDAGMSVIVIGSSRLQELEWFVRELGARHFVIPPITGPDLARLCRRQFSSARQLR